MGEVRKINKQFEQINNRNDQLQEDVKSSSKKQDEDLQNYSNKMAFQALENKFMKKEDIKTVENNMLGNVSKMEKRLSSVESVGKEANVKICELEKRNSEGNE